MSIKTLVAKILSQLPNVNKWQHNFLIHLFGLLVAFRGRHNFTNLARHSEWNESSYRNNYKRSFDWLSFNQKLVAEVCEKEMVIAFDPSFISKSGQCTPGLGYFWSGCAGQAKKGLEIGGFGAIDILNNTCMHLVCQQTFKATPSTRKTATNKLAKTSLLEQYGDLVVQLQNKLLNTSNILVVDAYFSKANFVNKVVKGGFEVVSRLRKDAALRYRYVGPHVKRKGARKIYAGKVNVAQPSTEHFQLVIQEDTWQAYEGVVYANSMKRWVKVLLVHHFDTKKELKKVHIYFSTDVNRAGSDILVYYKGRFQIEFLYRDGKQFAGLSDCQSRNSACLNFHFNAALTSVSLAKAVTQLSQANSSKPFSMYSVKSSSFNELFMKKIFKVFGITPKQGINSPEYQQIRDFGVIAA